MKRNTFFALKVIFFALTMPNIFANKLDKHRQIFKQITR